MAKQRLDILLVERGLAGSRERAKRMIMAGEVLVDNQKIDKAGATVKAEAEIRLLGSDIPYVSRGGLKLAKAMKEFGVEITGKRCADIGASTGGFTDCMLQNGAVQVFAIDVGYGQLAWKLRTDGELGFVTMALTYSPVKGPEGNIEYLIRLSKDKAQEDTVTEERIVTVVADAHGELDK